MRFIGLVHIPPRSVLLRRRTSVMCHPSEDLLFAATTEHGLELCVSGRLFHIREFHAPLHMSASQAEVIVAEVVEFYELPGRAGNLQPDA